MVSITRDFGNKTK
jgi:hypothetical protein